MNDYYIEIIKRKLDKTVADNLLEYIEDLEMNMVNKEIKAYREEKKEEIK